MKSTEETSTSAIIEIARTQVAFSSTFPVRVTPMICEALPPKAAPAPPLEF